MPTERATSRSVDSADHVVVQSFHEIIRGTDPERAALTFMRDLAAKRHHIEAKALADTFEALRPDSTWGAVLGGLYAALRGFDDVAARRFAQAGWDSSLDLVPAEAMRILFRSRPTDAAALVSDLASQCRPLAAEAWFEALGWLLAAEDFPRGREALDHLLRALDEPTRSTADIGHLQSVATWLKPWLASEVVLDRVAPSPENGSVPFALVDYRHPSWDSTSRNIGDYVQTLSSLGHIVRRPNLTFEGDADTVDLMTELQAAVAIDRRLDTPKATVDLTVVNRDASRFQAVASGTWVLAFGWFMDGYWDKGGFQLPLHPSLRPIFVSFHCARRRILTDDAVEYLKRYGPIGCRDWTTVDLLLSKGVPAFFSGCLTTTVRNVFPAGVPSPPEGSVAYVDSRREAAPPGAEPFPQSYSSMRWQPFAMNVRDARDRLQRYRDFERIVTSRLHCYLPARSLGIDVDFQPKTFADPRFSGLAPLTDEEFAEIQMGLDDKLASILTLIFSGANADEVYESWRSLTATDVERAEQRRSRPSEHPELRTGPRGAASGRTQVSAPGSATADIAIIVRPSEAPHLAPVVTSIQRRAIGPTRVTIIGPDLAPEVARELSRERHEVRVLDPKASIEAARGNTRGWPLRVLEELPVLLPDTGRVAVLPVATVVSADIAGLVNLAFAENVMAAPPPRGHVKSGFGRIHRAAERLDYNSAAAFELTRLAYQRHQHDFPPFELSLTVLDLDALRDMGFTPAARILASEFGLRTIETFHVLVGPRCKLIPPEWHHAPGQNDCDEPKLTYWPETASPWDPDHFAPGRDRWRAELATSAQ